MGSLVEILCVLEGKIGPVCWHLLHDVHAMDMKTPSYFFQIV